MAFLDPTDKNKPAYVHQEYPKHINFPDKTFKVANNASEEAEILAEHGHKIPSVKESSEDASSAKATEKAKQTLIGVAEKLGIEIDKRWGIDKINEAINAAFSAETTEKAEPEEE